MLESAKIDIKTLIAIGGILVTFGGFYYTTQMRLDTLEEKVIILESSVKSSIDKSDRVQKQLKRVSKRLEKLEK
tara:strand:- start:2356 stop:2577 length:222 start_codon:yes stop_codon:yes gene_type:complete